MTATLTSLRDRVEQTLADTSNAIWETGWIDEGITKALHEYSLARPLHKNGTISVSADTYELDISALTGVIGVHEVWSPYTAADPEHPPNILPFRHWIDSQELYFPVCQVSNGDVCRVFYTSLHTLNGLDSETVTTVGLEDESLLVSGSAGFVATDRGLDLSEQVTVTALTAQQVRAWGLSTLQQFRNGLRRVTQAKSGAVPSTAAQPRLDVYDNYGGFT